MKEKLLEARIQKLEEQVKELQAKNFALFTMATTHMSWDQTIGQAGFDQLNKIYGDTLDAGRG